jgi:DNA polymerase elongation subunit (family B)
MVCYRLLSTGHSLSEIVKVVMEVEDIKKSRIESLKLTQWEKLNLAMNSAGRTIRKVVRAKQQEEQDNKPNTVQARTA